LHPATRNVRQDSKSDSLSPPMLNRAIGGVKMALSAE
jgi:hypothetical protein